MFFRNDITVNTDISQTVISDKIVAYLTLLNRDASLIQEFKDNGQCVGFTGVAVYALFLYLTQNRRYYQDSNRLIPRDDWIWLKNAFTRIANWDETSASLKLKTESKRKLHQNMERVISLVMSLQHPDNYEKKSQLKLQQNLQDTCHREFHQEYTLAGLFTKVDFTQSIRLAQGNQERKTTLLKEIVKEDRMVFISCYEHMTGLIKHNHFYFYFNTNNPDGWEIYPEEKENDLIDDIFTSHFSSPNKLLPLTFNAICPSDFVPALYVSQAALLQALAQPFRLVSEDGNEATALYMAAEIGCRNSVRYYLKHPPIPLHLYVNMPCTDGLSPLCVAADEGQVDIVKDLLAAGAIVNLETKNKKTALMNAVLSNHLTVAHVLLEAGANPNILSVDSFTCLYLATMEDNVAMMRLLLKHHANPNKPAYGRNTPLHKAATHGNLQTAILLLAYHANPNAVNDSGETPMELALALCKIDMVDHLIHLPNIDIGKQQYQAIAKFVKAYPHDKQVRTWLDQAQPLVMMHIMKELLIGVQKQHPSICREAKAKLQQIKTDIYRKKMPLEEKITFIFQAMTPLFSRIQSQGSTLWQPPALLSMVIEQVERLNIPFSRKKQQIGFVAL